MKIKVTQKAFLAGIRTVQDVVKSTDADNPHRNIRVETPAAGQILLTGSNGDIQVQSRVFAETEGDCAMTLVGSRLAAFVDSMDFGTVEIVDGTRTRAKLVGGCAEFSLDRGRVSDFPMMEGPTGEGKVTYTVPAGVLREMLRKVRYAVSTDRTRKSLCGVLLRTESALPGMGSVLTAAATDGRRVSVITYEIGNTGDSEAVLPQETVGILMKITKDMQNDVMVECDGRSIRLTADDWSVTSKLIDETYPEFERVIPPDGNFPSRVQMNAELFRDNIRRAALSSWKDGRAVKLTFDDNVVTFEARNGFSSSRSRMGASYDGPKTVIKIDPQLVLDVLGCTDSDEVTFAFNDGRKPLMLTCDVQFKAVIMPIFMNEEE